MLEKFPDKVPVVEVTTAKLKVPPEKICEKVKLTVGVTTGAVGVVAAAASRG